MVDTNTPTPAEVAARLRDILDQIAFEHSRECSPTMPPLWTRLGAKRAILRQMIDNNAERIAAWLEDYERVQAWNDKHATLAFIHCHCDDCAPAHVELAARAKELGPAIVRVVEKEQP
jgi:hypothetical protein